MPRRIEDAKLAGLDLSSLRMTVNGAEPVNPETLRRFNDRFGRYGLRQDARALVFGLAESSVGLAFPPQGRPFVVDRIDRRELAEQSKATPARAGEPTLEIVGFGLPLPRHEFRVVDDTGRELSERHEGRLQFRGPSSTQGYFRNDPKTRLLFAGDGWVETGDRAYLANGELFIIGRVKDIVIRAGRNIYPQELEGVVGEIPGIRKGCAAVFGVQDPATATEKLVVVAETRETDHEARAKLRAAIDALATDTLGSPADDVVLAPPNAVPKTTSGKLRRSACRELYEKGVIVAPPKAVPWQLGLLALSNAWAVTRRCARAAGTFLYAGYFWSVVGLLAAIGWPLVCALPTLKARWSALRIILRLLAGAVGVRIEIKVRAACAPEAQSWW
ncbi:MAG: hypothetical protein EXQ91_03845 [Alphaproteobacteria bacterium]|nr:hypothetical protein [Alphaproteobacteria bacterium]